MVFEYFSHDGAEIEPKNLPLSLFILHSLLNFSIAFGKGWLHLKVFSRLYLV